MKEYIPLLAEKRGGCAQRSDGADGVLCEGNNILG
jgi:hypothetical protein